MLGALKALINENMTNKPRQALKFIERLESLRKAASDLCESLNAVQIMGWFTEVCRWIAF